MSLNIVVAKALTLQDRQGKEYTSYEIHVSRGDKKWTVRRRFRQIDALHKRMKRDFPNTKFNMPSKKLLGKLDPGFVEKRRSQLQDFFSFLVSQKPLSESDELALFLDPMYAPSFRSLENPDYSGVLKKKSDHTGRWRERYVVLQGRTLYHFKSADDWEATGTIALANYYKLSLPKHTKETAMFQFQIVSRYPKINNYTFLAGSLSDLEAWLAALRPVIEGSKFESLEKMAPAPDAKDDKGKAPMPSTPPTMQHDDDDDLTSDAE